MEMASNKKPIFEDIMSGKIKILVCAKWGQGNPLVPALPEICLLCDEPLTMDARNKTQAETLDLKPICLGCFMALRVVIKVLGGEEISQALIAGKVMSVEEGMIQAQLERQKN